MDKTKKYQYGYDINQIKKQIYRPKAQKTSWGSFGKVVENKNYGLDIAFVAKDKKAPLSLKKYLGKEAVLYVEQGDVVIDKFNLKSTETLFLPPKIFKKPLLISAKKDSFIYIFSGPIAGKISNFKKGGLYNFHNQPWADLVWTMANRDFAAKKIFFKKGNNSSFHFHCQKSETYFVHSGKLFLRLRAGKGEDRFFVVSPGQAVDIPPGLMHQAGGRTDTTIMEVSTKDSDSDAFLIESEFTKMPKLKLK